jgi:hypothetical protein
MRPDRSAVARLSTGDTITQREREGAPGSGAGDEEGAALTVIEHLRIMR